jgi:hypothetical protein
MDDGQACEHVTSWSAHHIPTGSAIRHILDTGNDAPIRLVIGDQDQVELGMAFPEATSIIAALQDAQHRVQAGTATGRGGPES